MLTKKREINEYIRIWLLLREKKRKKYSFWNWWAKRIDHFKRNYTSIRALVRELRAHQKRENKWIYKKMVTTSGRRKRCFLKLMKLNEMTLKWGWKIKKKIIDHFNHNYSSIRALFRKLWVKQKKRKLGRCR